MPINNDNDTAEWRSKQGEKKISPEIANGRQL